MLKFGAHAFVWTGDWTTRRRIGACCAKRAWRRRTCSLVLPPHAHAPGNPDGAVAFLTRAIERLDEPGARVRRWGQLPA